MSQVTAVNVMRHYELFNPYEFEYPVHVIGAGASGSWLVLQLAKLGITNITVWDFDTVEEHNIANQAFNIDQIGEYKAYAIEGLVRRATDTSIKAKPNKVDASTRLSGVVFCMIDSMSGRKEIWDNCIKYKPSIAAYFEPRMGLHMGRIYNVNPMNPAHITKYEETLYGDEETEVSACGASMSVITSAMTLAAWTTRQLINFVEDKDDLLDNEILIDMKYNNIITNRW